MRDTRINNPSSRNALNNDRIIIFFLSRSCSGLLLVLNISHSFHSRLSLVQRYGLLDV
jgi:hypothetical protein